MKLSNSKILVTGANRGIGRALVEEALARGVSTVYAGARDPASLADLAARSGGRVVPLALDLLHPEALAATAAQVGSLDLVVNNAGLLSSASLLAGSLEAVERDMATNFWGTLAVTRAFLPALERSGTGSAVANVLTVVALASMPALGGYSASKAAAFSLTQALRGELGKKGISVHAVFPGPVDTEMSKAITLPKTAPAEVARAILDGIEAGEEDIFPDAMARQVGLAWSGAPKSVEKMFAGM